MKTENPKENPSEVRILVSRAFKFGVVGFSGILIDYAVTIVFREVLELNEYLANCLGFATAATSNFLINRKWTFRSEGKEAKSQYVVFIIISLFGLAINNLIIFLIYDKYLNLGFYWSKLIAIIIVFFWNFSINNSYNFKDRR